MLGGLNWIDGMIILLLALTIVGSIRVGLLTQLCIIGTFFGALFLGGWLFPHVLPMQDPTWRTALNANLVLVCAGYAAVKGFELGRRFHWSLRQGRGRKIEQVLGAIPGLAAALITVWLLASMIGRMPFVGFSNSVNDALIVQTLTRALPPVPAVLAVFNHQVDPNTPPHLFAKPPKPQESFAFSPEAVGQAEAKAKKSLVRITGFGCGGLGSGSGFAVAKDLVATNAHVVAGVERPIVKHDNHSYEAVPVLFDSALDVAILRVLSTAHVFTALPLPLADHRIENDTSVAVLGYPGGDYTAAPGLIRSNQPVRGRTIYELGVVTRNVYDVQTTIKPGSSGGPVVLADGQVAGIIFATYDAVDDYAAALSSQQLRPAVEQAKQSQQRISTGACLAG